MFVRANGISLYYETRGTGPDLLLIHGAGGNSRYWVRQVAVFATRYRVTCIDLRGHGQSESPSTGYTIPDFVEDLRQTLPSIGIHRAVLAGFSMGGRIASHLASLEPDIVQALVLTNSTVGPLETPPGARERTEALLKTIREGDTTSIAENSTRVAFSPGLRERDPAAWDIYYQMCLANSPAGRLGLMEASLTSKLPDTDLSAITCPVLMIQGTQDLVVPATARERSHQLMKNARLLVLPTGHASALEAPEAWNKAVMEFLQAVLQD
jgi:pimeloyl-ACP methyl ester carboxylesterase